jgi:hypothetical protein
VTPPPEPSDIEFLDDSASTGDEFEELPAEPTHPRWRRARGPIAVVLSLAVAALVVVRVIPSGQSHPAAAGSSAPASTVITAEPRPTLSDVTVIPAPSLAIGSTVIIPRIDPRLCSGGRACFATDSVPPDVLAAVQDAFPGAHLVSALDVQAGRGDTGSVLRYRTLTARAGAITVVVEVRPPSDHDQLNSIRLGGTAARPSLITLVHSGAFTVAVTVTNDRIPVRIQAVSKLAGDRRLLAAG